MKALNVLKEMDSIINSSMKFHDNKANFEFNEAYYKRNLEAIEELEQKEVELQMLRKTLYSQEREIMELKQKYELKPLSDVCMFDNGWMRK